MALISMAVYDTEANQRTWMTAITLKSLQHTVNWDRHRLVIVDNNSCEQTKRLLRIAHLFIPNVKIITNTENLGTARAVSRGWRLKKKREHCLKLDNDCSFRQSGWLDAIEDMLDRDKKLGIAACKRSDLEERPDHKEEGYKSELVMLPHNPGQTWLCGEKVLHAVGTCTLFSWRLLQKIGELWQIGPYALDDSIACTRCQASGFWVGFLPNYAIDHVDPGNSDYQREKEAIAGNVICAGCQVGRGVLDGIIDPYMLADDPKVKLTQKGALVHKAGKLPSELIPLVKR